MMGSYAAPAALSLRSHGVVVWGTEVQHTESRTHGRGTAHQKS